MGTEAYKLLAAVVLGAAVAAFGWAVVYGGSDRRWR